MTLLLYVSLVGVVSRPGGSAEITNDTLRCLTLLRLEGGQ